MRSILRGTVSPAPSVALLASAASVLGLLVGCGSNSDSPTTLGTPAAGGTSGTGGTTENAAGTTAFAGNSSTGGSSTGGGTAGGASGGSSTGAGGSAASGSGETPVVTPCPGEANDVGVWQEISPPEFKDPPNMETFHITLDPHDQSLYATAGNKTNGGDGSVGIFRSSDCGSSWQKVSTGENSALLETGTSFALETDWEHPGVLYDVNGYGQEPTLFKSINGGVDWEELYPDVDGVTGSSFAQTFGLDPLDPAHLVLTFHEDCKAPHAPMCFSETTDGGETWREFAGPSDGWKEAAFIVMLGGPSWLFEAGDAWLTTDSGATWDKVLTSYQGFANGSFLGGHLGPDGTLYIGVSNTGIAVSHADPTNEPPIPLGKEWSLLPNSPQASHFADDGERLFANWKWDTSGQPMRSAAFSDLSSWTHMATPEGGLQRGGNLLYDMAHHILYTANGTSGLWRVKTQ